MKTITSYLHDKFPTYGESNVFWFYIVDALGSSWFQIGNWLLFVLLFMGAEQFAVYESIAFGIGILLEIPSGAFADLLGKRRSIILGYSMTAIGSILFTLAYFGNAYIFFGNILIIGGFAFISGSMHALVYDTLVEKNKVEHYDDVIGKSHSLSIAVMVLVGIIGGIAWRFNTYAPWTLTAIAFVFAATLSLKFIEPAVDTEVFSFKNFIKQNRRGFYYLFKSSFRKYTFSIAMISGTYLMWSTGIIRILMGRDFGFNGEAINYLVAGTLLVSFITTYMFKTIKRKIGDRIGYSALIAISAIGWIMAALFTKSLVAGAFVFIVLTIAGNLAELWTSVILNKHVHSKDRATAISTLSFLIQIPYVFIAVAYGYLITNGLVTPFYFITGGILACATVLFYIVDRKK